MKKLLSKVISFTLALTLLVAVAQPFAAIKSSALTGEELIPYLTYSLGWIQHTADDYEYYIKITDCDTSVSGDIVIPSEIDGYTVRSIIQYSFFDCTGITSITLPSTINAVTENNPFRDCSNLENIFVDEGNTTYCSIDGVLYNSKSKTIVAYPEGKTDDTFIVPTDALHIAAFAFHNCLVKNVVLTDSIKDIDYNAFDGCKNLTSITMPKSNCEIGTYAFNNCEKLESIVLPAGLTVIEQSSFSGCKALKSVNIPDTVTKISSNAFSICSSLASIDLPDGLEEIGKYAFSYCKSIKSISIPDSVTTINSYAFKGSGLIEVDYPSALTYIPYGCFEGCNFTHFYIPDSIETVADCAFSECRSLKSVVIPESVQTIGKECFMWCDKLKFVLFEGSNTELFNDTVFKFAHKKDTFDLIAHGDSLKDYCENNNNINYIPLNFDESENAIRFDGDLTVYQGVDYSGLCDIVSMYSGAEYLYFDKLVFDGVQSNSIIYLDDFETAQKDAEYLTFNNLYVSVSYNGETISFDKMLELIENGEHDLFLVGVEDKPAEEEPKSFFEQLFEAVFGPDALKTIKKVVDFIRNLFK